MKLILQTSKVESGSVVPLTRPSPVELSEILLCIFSFLPQSELRAVASRVSRQWHVVARELIERAVCLKLSNPGAWEDLAAHVAKATRLTLGNRPGRQVFPLKPAQSIERWKSLIDLLNQLNQAPTGSADNRRANRPVRVTDLTMYVEPWWLGEIASHTLFNAAHLTRLTMYMSWYETGSHYIEWMLDQCPNLFSLSLIGCQPHAYSSSMERTEPQVPGSGSKGRTDSWPLQCLSIQSLYVELEELGAILPKLEDLSTISLTHVRRKDTLFTFQYKSVLQAFWESLARHCLFLKAISYSTAGPAEDGFPVGLFPFVTDFGVKAECVTVDNPTWQALSRPSRTHRSENRLTSLTLLGTHGTAFRHCAALRRFLCASPFLLHFKIVDTWLPPQIIFENLADDWIPPKISFERTTDIGSPCRWACRGLKTLSIRYHGMKNCYESSIECRTLFGYLGRVCPELQELSVTIPYLNPDLAMDTVLLTRLHNLQRLELCLAEEQPIPYKYWQLLRAAAFAWIQPTDPKSVPCSVLSSLYHSILANRGGRLHKDPKEYLKMVQKNTRRNDKFRVKVLRARNVPQQVWTNWPQRRSMQRQRLLQQQQENSFRTDYDRVIPMVDGLVDFLYLGSSLDVEACLQAQMRPWLLQQRRERMKGVQVESVQERPSEVTTTTLLLKSMRPWKKMEQFIFTIVDDNDLKSNVHWTRDIAREACKGLRQLRPDIEFQCRVNWVGKPFRWE